MPERITHGNEYLNEIGLDELPRLDINEVDRIPVKQAERLLEQGRIEGRDLYQQFLTLFENPPASAEIFTREQMGRSVRTADERQHKILCKQIMHPRIGDPVRAQIYLTFSGGNPSDMRINIGLRSSRGEVAATKWLRRGGDISETDTKTTGRQAVGEARQREEMRRWLEAFKA